MTLAYLCIVVSLFIPLGCAIYAKLSVKGYNNRTPREFLAGLEGKAKRANYAQNNFYETFPAFGVGVVVAHQLGAVQSTVDSLAITYVIARISYAVFYIIDNHILRTAAWFVGFGATLALFFSNA
ncbi:MAG: hypothetical protein A2Z88_07060 [Omnitrophica WOR_2 bacterium GWA2_47_8]|nr:MAG: hypothetical protein A2Z88_07060 [Omnitrophica WOR_2 bacterium GWA2_47_8]